jgi:small-conductance mechanosensitive channel
MTMSAVDALLSITFLQNTLFDWGLALLVFLVVFLILPVVRGRVHARQSHWRESLRDSPALDLFSQLLARTNRLVQLVVALDLAEKILTLPPRIDRAFGIIIVVSVWLQVGVWASVALRFFISRRQIRTGTDDGASQGSVEVLMFCAQLIIWAIIALLALDNLGVNITALVAGLGVGGIAVALAVQTILGDLFGSLSIAFDKPFALGDTLKLDDYEGVVEHIGIKSTRLRSVTGEQIILANADVLKSRVRNLGRMPERRTLFRICIAYDTPPEKVEQVAALVQQAVTAQAAARFVSCLLVNLGAYALEFEIVYFVKNVRGTNLAVTVDAVNRGIIARFAAAGIAFAYPTRRNL